MILEADLGNTRLKWRFWSGAKFESGVCNYSELASLPTDLSITRVRASAVVSQDLKDQFSAWVWQCYGIEVEFARVSQSCAGVQCAYRDATHLGVDRWLALLAANDRYRCPLIVVDCGTAITVDVLGAGMQHAGGYILPGFDLMHSSLGMNTASVAVSCDELGSIALGKSTEECVSNGIFMSVVALLQVLMRRQAEGDELLLVVTGGGGRKLLSVFPSAQWSESLVLDGLAIALP